MTQKNSEITNQIIFDTVVEHFKTQKVRAVQRNIATGQDLCQYRTYNGLRCAVGALITDKEYNHDMDGDYIGGSVDALVKNGIFPKRLLPFLNILEELQTTHDVVAKNKYGELVSEEVADNLKIIATNYRLDSSKVDW